MALIDFGKVRQFHSNSWRRLLFPFDIEMTDVVSKSVRQSVESKTVSVADNSDRNKLNLANMYFILSCSPSIKFLDSLANSQLFLCNSCCHALDVLMLIRNNWKPEM